MPPSLRRTGHARRYSLGGSGDYPRSISVSAVELSRNDSLTIPRGLEYPSSQSLSETTGRTRAAEARGREESRGPGRGKAATSNRKNDLASVDDASAGYDSDEEFVKLYGMVAEHRAAERAIVSSAFAKVLSRPHSGTCNPKVATGSGCSSIARSGSGCSSIARSGSGCSPKIASHSGCRSSIRSIGGCKSIVRSGSGCSSNMHFVSGKTICTNSETTCGVAAAHEDEGLSRVLGCAAVCASPRRRSTEMLMPSARAAVLGPQSGACTVSGSQPRVSLDSARANDADFSNGKRSPTSAGLNGSNEWLSSVYMPNQQQPHPLQATGNKRGFSRSASVSVSSIFTPDSALLSHAKASSRGVAETAWHARENPGTSGDCLSPQVSIPAVNGASSNAARHLRPGHRRRVSSSAISVDLNSLCYC
ncbi:hypothetical protein CLOP_g24949 [Closterium sp. NIES-67]|nr:hypothetical protein CLOP_g24949 [Closterium sp. NIES-67]